MGTKEKRAPPKSQKPETSRRGVTRPLGAEVPAIAKAALGRKGFAEAGLLTHWRDIVGPDLARLTQPVKLGFARGQKSGGTLTLRCGGSAALEIQHLTPVILARINGHLGHAAIARIKIEQAPLAARTPRSAPLPEVNPCELQEIAFKVEPVRDHKLRDRLLRLGIAMRRRQRAGD